MKILQFISTGLLQVRRAFIIFLTPCDRQLKSFIKSKYVAFTFATISVFSICHKDDEIY